MSWLIWPGAAVAFIGVIWLIYCIYLAAKARSAGLQGEQMTRRLQKIVAYNMGALAISTLGLMMVVMGILLG